MAEQVFSADPGSLTASGSYAYDMSADLPGTSMQPTAAPAPDADEYTFPGAYAEGQNISGASFGNNPAMPGSATAPGQPEGSLGGAGSTGIVGDIPHGV